MILQSAPALITFILQSGVFVCQSFVSSSLLSFQQNQVVFGSGNCGIFSRFSMNMNDAIFFPPSVEISFSAFKLSCKHLSLLHEA